VDAPTPRVAAAPAEAGRRNSPSDLAVTVEPRDGGGIALEVRSKVEPYYGQAIRTQTEEVLRALGVAHARVVLEDQGALPFTLAARVEAAVRRAGWGQGRRALLPALPLPEGSPKGRRRRSRLYLPGMEPKFMVNARIHLPDAVILDLEDSVHPGEKDAARLLVRNALTVLDFTPCERMVRVNPFPAGRADLEEVVPAGPDVILLPKTETAEQVREADAAIAIVQTGSGGTRPIWLLPILESALGIENAFAIATASDRVIALTIGLEDYTADLGVVKTAVGEESLYARSRLVVAARAAGVQAIDSVYGDVEDLEGLAAYARRSRAMGFDGMGCVHPRQIAVIHCAFAPSDDEIAKAVRIVRAYEEAQARGLGVVSLGSKMIDPPVVKRALRVVEEARADGIPVPGPEGTA
jgi:citrate lyase subunit beta / citryl-CoA lyase